MQTKILRSITQWQSPSFMAFFPCSASFPAMLADMYFNAVKGAHFNRICFFAVTDVDAIMIDWLVRALNLLDYDLSTGPTRGGGVIQGTAYEAILATVVAARDKHRPPNRRLGRKEETRRLRGKLVALG